MGNSSIKQKGVYFWLSLYLPEKRKRKGKDGHSRKYLFFFFDKNLENILVTKSLCEQISSSFIIILVWESLR